ncbi:MAG: hypothetical protein A2Y59_02390 [Chloroflexi bacterium RBG_13_52_14]|nr:MAG: hypothetical protein A2Y59_02390 [Chloroflexi bacterium RBG_13_52_14]
MQHFQLRFVKEVKKDGRIVTFTEGELGRLYPHDQKTLRGSRSPQKAISRAKEFNPDLPADVQGMVIVGFRPGKIIIASGSEVKPYTRGQSRKSGTTEWLRFINREGKIFSILPGHKIGVQLC